MTPADRDQIAFPGVTRKFGANAVLDDLSFGVGVGERVPLIGPSCSGRTTILRMLMTLTEPDSGTITVDGDLLFHEARNGSLAPAGE